MRRVTKALWIALALVFLFEAWLWRHLTAFIHWLVDLFPLEPLKQRLATFVGGLSPYATLPVFVIPFILLLPLKFLEVHLIWHHRWFAATLVLVLAKLLGLGVTAFIFDVTRPKLLQLAWFRWLYETMLVWLAKAHALVDPYKQQIKDWMADARRRIDNWFAAHSGRSGLLRRIARLRRRLQTGEPAE